MRAEVPAHQQVVRVSVTGCENVTVARGGNIGIVVVNEAPLVLELETIPLGRGQSPGGEEVHERVPCVSVNANW